MTVNGTFSGEHRRVGRLFYLLIRGRHIGWGSALFRFRLETASRLRPKDAVEY
jgi:hypothetical protein